MMELLVGLGAAAIVTLASSFRVLREWERGVVLRLGRLTAARGAGPTLLLPFGIEKMIRVPLRIVCMDIPKQDVITRDNVSIQVNAVVYFRVSDPVKATVVVQDYLFATSQLAQTTVRSVVGTAELDQLLAEREKFNDKIRQIVDEETDPWGIDVTAVEIKDVDLPREMQRAIARQAEAERERRAKVINAEGELQASEKLAQAAGILQVNPAAIQLRYLQTVSEIATENNSTTLFPIPIDLVRPFVERFAGAPASAAQPTVAQAAPPTPALPPGAPASLLGSTAEREPVLVRADGAEEKAGRS
jgi:regulator of protease activity HflC (stomatin/prohibitin superfamily)